MSGPEMRERKEKMKWKGKGAVIGAKTKSMTVQFSLLWFHTIYCKLEPFCVLTSNPVECEAEENCD